MPLLKRLVLLPQRMHRNRQLDTKTHILPGVGVGSSAEVSKRNLEVEMLESVDHISFDSVDPISSFGDLPGTFWRNNTVDRSCSQYQIVWL